MKNVNIANNIIKQYEFPIKREKEQIAITFDAIMQALEYKDKEIAKIKEALQSVLNEFSKFNIG